MAVLVLAIPASLLAISRGALETLVMSARGYRRETNIRMISVLGFVGGLGQMFYVSLSLFQLLGWAHISRLPSVSPFRPGADARYRLNPESCG